MKTSTDTLTGVRDHYADVARKAEDCSGDLKEGAQSRARQMGEEVAAAVHGAERVASLPKAAVSSCRGCADSVGRAALQPGETVLDLGSGGGADALIAAQQVGSTVYVYGLDMTDEMLALAARNAEEAQVTNVEFLKGHIEDIPLPNRSVDAVLSNCVLNFSANKRSVLREAFRVLRPGGRIIISDIVSLAPIPTEAYDALCSYLGCLNGMSSLEEYQALFESVGFERVVASQTTVYSYARLEEKALARGREDQFAPLKGLASAIDGVSGSVIFEAQKPEA
ncbi:MAG: methyltransferase domain-containing protein [Coriobacteriales bacterium]|jgi:ubiquinone/menaquinone biosynthesis C-methylase UbiE|nr:methyltransferase domain-containing protein [Coriobacteriales bacterium]